MIASESRLLDIQTRDCVLECMEIVLRLYRDFGDEYFMERAKEYGTFSEQLKVKIEAYGKRT